MTFTLKIDKGTMKNVLQKAQKSGINPVDFLSWKQQLEFDVSQDDGRLKFVRGSGGDSFHEYVGTLLCKAGWFRAVAEVEWQRNSDVGYLLEVHFTPTDFKLYASTGNP